MAAEATKKFAVVTGANKGLGFEICKQLASQSQGNITVVLTARDSQRGLEAVEKLKEFGHGDHVIFHQLDVTDSASVAALTDFIKSKFGKLDILVNNAGVAGANVDAEGIRAAAKAEDKSKVNWDAIVVETYATAEAAFQINYYGVKKMTEALLPLLKLSASPRIVNMSSIMGQLKNVCHEWAKGILSNMENLTEEKLEEVVNAYLKAVKDGAVKERGWPSNSGSYIVSKAVVTTYTRLLAKKNPECKINAICPGYTKTDMNHHSGFLTVEEGAESPVRLALLPEDDGSTGLFFNRKEVVEF
ncbi:(+)-neomenthol dehydrogenase-like [Andrographis paniculata]|uniref:(+)-neomenthol dehydrogenase-like n=1 Tax=Andrographis paniculata TaxID=175694 RepID=UPI0021E99E86|nr:(+)-neomenthol dehydrogenase-like [Andrographis paniculata]